MGPDTFYELSRRSIPLAKYDGTFLSWRDSVIAVRTDKGMHFLEFSHDLNCVHKNIDLLESSLASHKTSPATELCESKFINDEMKNYDYTEMILDSSFWPHNASLTQEMTNISMSAWAPPKFFKKNVVALLNNIGGVEFFIKLQHNWTSMLDLSPSIRNCLEYKCAPKTFEEMKKAVYIVETYSICWASDTNTETCYFVTAQKNGVVVFWEFSKDLSLVCKGQIQSELSGIRFMKWLRKKENTIWLICSDVLGQINTLEIQITSDGISLLNTYVLWDHQDRMVASNINHMAINENVILFFSKHRHFIAQLLDKNCNVLSQYVNNVNDHRITDIMTSCDELYLATINVNIYKLVIGVTENTLSVDLVPIELKDSYPTYELYSILFSKTNTLFALGMIDRRLLCRKEVFKVDVVFMSTDTKLNSLVPILLNNPERRLTNYWDCIEALRYKMNRLKSIPVIDGSLLFAEASNDVYKLKVYLTILILYLNMKKMAKSCDKLNLPELSVEVVKEKILLLHAQSTINKLYNKYKTEGQLIGIEEETLAGCIKYIELYSKRHKVKINIDADTLGIMKTNYKYLCQSCDDKIIGFSCKSGHLNMFCVLTLTPIIGDDYLVCRSCGATARADLSVEEPLCTFCDQFLLDPDKD